MKIKLYYGPRKGFEKYLPDKSRPKNLTQLIELSDQNKRAVRVDIPNVEKTRKNKPKFKNVIATTEEYSLLSDSGLNGLITLINEFTIENIFFQNPPQNIVQQLKKVYGGLSEDKYIYKTLGLSKLKEFSTKFDIEILGQERAKYKLISSLYQLAKNYTKSKPLILMFYGPAGVGKTETAKLLSNVLGQKLFRKQFSMFQNSSFADYIFGASHNSSSLARDLLERESNIILFDEFDKPNSVFFSAFYQMFDEGEFIDKNYKVDLKNTIIICTSNFTDKHQIKEVLGDAIYSRFDSFIEFSQLSPDVILELITRMFNKTYSALDSDDKKLLNADDCLALLLSIANGNLNARELDKFVKEFIFARIITNSEI